jgi:hypothetical protein
MEDGLIFGLVLGIALSFMFYKWKTRPKTTTTNEDQKVSGGSGQQQTFNKNVK